MIYFFAKAQQFTQCEIHPGPPHLLRVITPNGSEEIERYRSWQDVEYRWAEITERLHREGWSGPMGRDARG
jgi:hypothetical protein